LESKGGKGRLTGSKTGKGDETPVPRRGKREKKLNTEPKKRPGPSSEKKEEGGDSTREPILL